MHVAHWLQKMTCFDLIAYVGILSLIQQIYGKPRARYAARTEIRNRWHLPYSNCFYSQFTHIKDILQVERKRDEIEKRSHLACQRMQTARKSSDSFSFLLYSFNLKKKKRYIFWMRTNKTQVRHKPHVFQWLFRLHLYIRRLDNSWVKWMTGAERNNRNEWWRHFWKLHRLTIFMKIERQYIAQGWEIDERRIKKRTQTHVNVVSKCFWVRYGYRNVHNIVTRLPKLVHTNTYTHIDWMWWSWCSFTNTNTQKKHKYSHTQW